MPHPPVSDGPSRLNGSCLCGQISFQVVGPLRDPLNCHCTMCRKAHGAAFRSRAAIDASGFRWLTGQSLVSRYESSRGEVRTFCSNCGSNLITEFEHNKDVLGLPLGVLDDDPGDQPQCHVFVGSKASWHEITDALPQWQALPGPVDT